MTPRTIEQRIIAVLEKYSLRAECTAEVVMLRDKKDRLIGTIESDGTVTRRSAGAQQLMGALVRNDLVAALRETTP